MLQRQDLEALQRDKLVERARMAGVERPEVLTRLELMDEILSVSIADEQERKVARGLLGRARDLVARVVEKGLNLPDAAQRLRTLAPPIAAWRRAPPPIATVSLAEIYAGQGHGKLALKVLDDVLEREPDHAYARRLRDRIVAGAVAVPTQDVPAEQQPQMQEPAPEPAPTAAQPQPAAPAAPPERRSAVPANDDVTLKLEKRCARLTWRLRPTTFARARCSSPHGRMVVRMAFFEPGWDGPRIKTEDQVVDALAGRLAWAVSDNTQGLCAALGWLTDHAFTPLVAASWTLEPQSSIPGVDF